MNYRIEQDLLGNQKVPENALYGSQTARVVENFPVTKVTINLPP